MNEYIQAVFDFITNVFAGLVNNVLLAIIILLVGFILGKMLSKLLQRVLVEIKLNKILEEITSIKFQLEEFLSHLLLYFIYFISIITALRQLGIATEILNILSGVIIVLIGIFIVLSVKDFIPNIISGIVIHQKDVIKKGDKIEFKNVSGKVIEITLLDTKLETTRGDTIIIPNVNLTKNEFVIKKARITKDKSAHKSKDLSNLSLKKNSKNK